MRLTPPTQKGIASLRFLNIDQYQRKGHYEIASFRVRNPLAISGQGISVLLF